MKDAPFPLTAESLEKSFGGIPVLSGVSVSFEPGTITALAGENGAGKSTLMKIISGQYRPDSGRVLVRDIELPAGNAAKAVELGVAIVPQELAAALDLSVWENIFIGRENKFGFGVLDRKGMELEAQGLLDAFEAGIDARTMMRDLPVGLRQIVEIVKATSRRARVILLDEPSSAIAEREVERLLGIMRTLRDSGVTLVFTTHKMEEIRAVADRVIVLRDGNLVADSAASGISDDEIVTAMIGRELNELFPERGVPLDETVLQIESMVAPPGTQPATFSVRRGEIIGLAGLVGAGRTELLETIFGVRRATTGTVLVSGVTVEPGKPAKAIQAGMAFVPEDRKGAGLVLSQDVLANGTLPRIRQFSRFGWLGGKSRVDSIGQVMKDVGLRSRGLGQEVETLSGGNQQKIVLARWLTSDVSVLLLDEPTRGVDVGARGEIYRIIDRLARSGMAVILASSDLPEILGMAHRAFVLRDGAIVEELAERELGEPDIQDRIFRIASGLTTSPLAANTRMD